MNLKFLDRNFQLLYQAFHHVSLLPEEAEDLIKTFMRENNVILFLKKNFESSDIQGCEGKVIGTNVAQGATMSTGDTLIFIIDNTEDDS